ncbi:MAG: tyrosine-type recombinase/integrase [Malacoplasma sp.]|nr:tyrosine-type recombinase/integrase [Malacoplasma sp.]
MEKNDFIKKILESISPYIWKKNVEDAKNAIEKCFEFMEVKCIDEGNPITNEDALALFLDAKRIEGCSEKSIKYYLITLKAFFKEITKNYLVIETEDIRKYLSDYQQNNNVSKVTIDNVRRVISTLFTWLESENYITKSPTRRIRKVKTGKVFKETYSDEMIELIRKATTNIRDLALIDFLITTGVRVGELVKLNKNDLNLDSKECIVIGKGNKQRKVYFDAKTKIEIQQYLDLRKDDNSALFVSLFAPYNRLQISGVEILLRKIGKKLNVKKVHPHKFRRTLATKAIDKGMPIEQVQKMLGHAKIDTTLEYAMVDDNNVKNSHKKYLE